MFAQSSASLVIIFGISVFLTIKNQFKIKISKILRFPRISKQKLLNFSGNDFRKARQKLENVTK